VGNVTLPTPVFLAGGALCLLAGVMVGSVLGPGTPERTTAEVASFDRQDARLCLEGEAIAEHEGVDDEGRLCGTWRRTPGSQVPKEGDTFRFLSVSTSGEIDGRDETQVVIYGDVAAD